MSDIITTRKHRIYTDRNGQLQNNIKALKGGRPYIEARLYRAPNESDLSWNGSPTADIPGRKERAYLINDAGRIASKINQYLFAAEATRSGIDPKFATDVTTTGLTVNRFWEGVSDLFTAGQWVWLHADRGAPQMDNETGRPIARTLAQREAAGDRVYWSMWASSEIVDWSFDKAGGLLWILTAETQYENVNPFEEAKRTDIRVLWRRGEGGAGASWTRYKIDDKGKTEKIAEGTISIPDVPFVLLGVPSSDPWWYDDVEMIQAALLNLASLHYENLVKTVYPQLVIPMNMSQMLESKMLERYGSDKGVQVIEMVRELVRGLDRPFIESGEDKGLTRYLQPSALDLAAIPTEEDRRRKVLFDMVGLALFNRESRQVQSAESKQFDHMDTNATLRNRSMLLGEAETKLVILSAKLDTLFATYEPAWPQDFDVPNTKEDVAALTQLANFTQLPPSMVKQILKACVKLLDQIERITPEDRAVIMAEIEQLASDASSGAQPPADMEARLQALQDRLNAMNPPPVH